VPKQKLNSWSAKIHVIEIIKIRKIHDFGENSADRISCDNQGWEIFTKRLVLFMLFSLLGVVRQLAEIKINLMFLFFDNDNNNEH